MARHLKQGLDYYPHDTDMVDDSKIKLLRARFGLKGYAVWELLLAKIYRVGGYLYQWDDDELMLFAQEVGNGVTIAFVNDVISELVRRDLLDKGMFDRFRILTSKGIQERYKMIVSLSKLKRPGIDPKYDVTNLANLRKSLTSEFTAKTSEEITESTEESTQSKGNQTKVNEMKSKCVGSDIWIQGACVTLGTDEEALTRFCNRWIDEAVIKLKFDRYDVNSLISFMVTDFAKEKQPKKGGIPAKGAEGILEVHEILKRDQQEANG